MIDVTVSFVTLSAHSRSSKHMHTHTRTHAEESSYISFQQSNEDKLMSSTNFKTGLTSVYFIFAKQYDFI